MDYIKEKRKELIKCVKKVSPEISELESFVIDQAVRGLILACIDETRKVMFDNVVKLTRDFENENLQ